MLFWKVNLVWTLGYLGHEASWLASVSTGFVLLWLVAFSSSAWNSDVLSRSIWRGLPFKTLISSRWSAHTFTALLLLFRPSRRYSWLRVRLKVRIILLSAGLISVFDVLDDLLRCQLGLLLGSGILVWIRLWIRLNLH
jgi:hypothetical protein